MIFNTKHTYYSYVLLFFFLKKHFFKYLNLRFFSKVSTNNLVKSFTIFILSAPNLSKTLSLYNLNKVQDWYSYNYNNANFVFLTKKLKKSFFVNTNNVTKILLNYKVKLNTFSQFLNLNFNNFLHIWAFSKSRLDLSKVFINDSLKKLNSDYYPVRFNESSSNKFIDLNKIDNYSFFFIRKNRIFNKGRYSRNRQTYRTGVYWCLWFNILSVYGLYFVFYRFTFNFGYLWLPLIIFFGSFIFSRALKYNFINYNYVYTEIKKFYIWASLLYNNFFLLLNNFFLSFFKKYSSLYLFSHAQYFNKNNFLIKYLYTLPFYKYISLLVEKNNSFENVWTSLNSSSNKFFLKI